MGEYIDSKTKILHKCDCQREWMVTPNNVLKGKKCGCVGSGNSEKKYKNRRTILYYLKVDSIYKIGLTIWETNMKAEEQILNVRYGRKVYDGLNIEIIDYEVFEDGSMAFRLEQKILNEFNDKKYKYISDNMNFFPGYTELFSENIFSC